MEAFKLVLLVITDTMGGILILHSNSTSWTTTKLSLVVALVLIIKMVLQKGEFVDSLNWVDLHTSC